LDLAKNYQNLMPFLEAEWRQQYWGWKFSVTSWIQEIIFKSTNLCRKSDQTTSSFALRSGELGHH
jgi:hypothetical protein